MDLKVQRDASSPFQDLHLQPLLPQLLPDLPVQVAVIRGDKQGLCLVLQDRLDRLQDHDPIGRLAYVLGYHKSRAAALWGSHKRGNRDENLITFVMPVRAIAEMEGNIRALNPCQIFLLLSHLLLVPSEIFLERAVLGPDRKISGGLLQDQNRNLFGRELLPPLRQVLLRHLVPQIQFFGVPGPVGAAGGGVRELAGIGRNRQRKALGHRGPRRPAVTEFQVKLLGRNGAVVLAEGGEIKELPDRGEIVFGSRSVMVHDEGRGHDGAVEGLGEGKGAKKLFHLVPKSSHA